MLNHIDAVIFDLDGTLIDSMWVWKKVDELYVEKYKIDVPENFASVLEGMSYTEVAQYFRDEFHLPLTVEEIKQEWQDMSLDMYRNDVELKDATHEFLVYLQGKGIKTGIATSCSRAHAEAVLEERGISQYIHNITTSCDVNIGKPAPDVYLKAASNLGVEPFKCLAFEDVPNGVMAAQAAGMKVCAIEDKSNVEIRGRLRELADYYISTYREILEKEVV